MRGRSLQILAVACGALILLSFVFYTQRSAMTFDPTSHQDNNLKVPLIDRPSYDEPEVNPIPLESDLNKMSQAELTDFFYGYIMSTQTTCRRVSRMGRVGDGGWEICDESRYKPQPGNCLVYSFGINYNFEFDDAMERYGCDVYSYDPSMDRSVDHTRNQRIYFRKVGIGGRNEVDRRNWTLKTLGTLREENGHLPSQRRVDIVKMDVERAEFESLTTAMEEGSLEDVRQLSFETHIRVQQDPVPEFTVMVLKMLRKLWEKGFRMYHSHRNEVSLKGMYVSKIHKVQRTRYHDVYMVNIRNRMS